MTASRCANATNRVARTGFGIVSILAVAACAAPAPPGVAIEDEPRHQLVSDEAFAQVLNIQILGGDTTLYHVHARPIAYVCLGGSEVAAQPAGGEWAPPGSVCDIGSVISTPEYAESPLTHRVANTGIDLFHLIAVQNLREEGPPAAVGQPVGTTVLDNDWFHAQTVDLEPQAGEAAGTGASPHRHDVPTLLVLVVGDGVSSMGSDNRENILMEPGAWTWIAAGATHSLVGTTTTASRVVEIEVR